MNNKKVIIIGGGVGGLSLAQGLLKNGIQNFKLFERDDKESTRSQGYRIRIAGEGSVALKSILPEKTWKLFEKTCAKLELGGSFIDAESGSFSKRTKWMPVFNGTGNLENPQTFTVDRTTFRRVLLNGIEENCQFSKKFTHYTNIIEKEDTVGGIIERKRIQVHFSDGSNEIGDLLIAADGVNSLIRKQFLPSNKYFDTGCRVIYGKTSITEPFLTKIPASINEWMTVITDKKPVLLFLEPIKFNIENQQASMDSNIPLVQDYIYWVFGGKIQHFLGKFDSEMNEMSKTQLKDLILKMTENWEPSIRNVFNFADLEQMSYLRVSTSKPDINEWDSNENITFIGDSIHAMTPTGGSGANATLVDVHLLLETVFFNKQDKTTLEIIKSYETILRTKAKDAINGSLSGAKRLFGLESLDGCKELD